MQTGTIDQGTETGLVGKVIAGRWDQLNRIDAADIAQMVLMPVPVVGEPGSIIVSGLSGKWSAEEKKAKIEAALGIGKLEWSRRHSRAVRDTLDEMDGETGHALAGATAGAGGAIAGGALAGAAAGSIIPGAGTIVGGVIGIAGSIIGGVASQGLFDSVVQAKHSDALELMVKLHAAQLQGAQIPEEALGAGVVACLPMESQLRQDMAARLKQLTGTDKFSVAVAENRMEELGQLMTEFDTDIRAKTELFERDPRDPYRTVAGQFADLVNSRQLDVRAFLFDDDDLPSLMAIQAGTKLKGSGVYGGDSERMPQELPPSGGSKHGRA